jgi:bifunctional enzyme CysN/CysC
MKVVVVGHVDHGKSTLIGRLFHDAGALPEGRVDQLAAMARRRGVAFEFANFTDGLQAERDQNVTIDTTQILLRWRDREILFIDAPGHREFIKNMVTGAAQADAAILVIDAVDGVSDQTKRHALLLTILGVRQVVVVINKMDAVDVALRRARFDALSTAVVAVLESLGVSPAFVVPAAASLGWNVVNSSAELRWHDGPTVIDAILALTSSDGAAHREASHCVFSVQDVYRRNARRWLVGRFETGSATPGDSVIVLPSGHTATIDQVDPNSALTIREPLFVSRGDVLASPGAGLVVADTLHVRIFWLGRSPMVVGRRYEVRLGTQHADAELVEISRVIDASELTERVDRSVVPAHDVADVELRLRHPLVVDPSGLAPSLARLVVVDALPSPDIVGGGVILPSTSGSAKATVTAAGSQVSAEERHRRVGHRGAVVWLTGLSGAGKSTLADGLERTLFDRSMQAIVLDGDRVRFGLNADLGFSQVDRRENIRRVAEVAKLFAETGFVAITAFISPYAEDRQRARDIIAGAGVPFIEVFVDAALDVCEARDPKGLYRKARAGEIAEFTGVTAPYEAPGAAELTIRTAESSPAECVAILSDTVTAVVRG